MKKHVLFLLVCLGVATAHAQLDFKLMPKAGLNISNFTNVDNNQLQSEALNGIHIGVAGKFKFTNFYALQPEILYTQQGSDIGVAFFDNGELSGETIASKLNYLSLHITNKLYIAESGFNLQVAPVIDILISDENVEGPEGFDFAIAVGAGYEFPFGLSLDLRYKQGLVDVFGRNVNTGINNDVTTDVSDLVLNKVIQLSVGYQFDF